MAAAEYAAPPDPKEGLFVFENFAGLRNNVSPEQFAPGDLVTGTNIDLDDGLNIHRRYGYGAPVVSGVDRDLWSSGPVCLAVGSNALKQILPDYSTITLRSGLTASQPLSYAAVGDRVLYANGVESGCVQNGASRSWGLAVPGVPNVAATGGSMTAGLYQIAMTYLRSDGQESGAGRATTIELTAAGGISLTAMPVSADPDVTHKVVYATSAGGETLYQVGVISNTDTAFVIREVRTGASPLLTQFLAPPPAGQLVAESRGHMLVANGNRLYPSEPYAPELFDLRKAVPFADQIVMIAPINDGKVYRQHGVYIGTNTQLIWLEGDSPEKWEFRVIAEYGVVPGTLFYGDGELFGAGDQKEKIAFFMSKQGMIAGKMGGDFVNITQHRYAIAAMDRGAAVVRRHAGMGQFLVTMQGTAQPANVA